MRLKECVILSSITNPSSNAERKVFAYDSEVALQSAMRFTPSVEHKTLFPNVNSNRTRNSVDIHSRVSVFCKTMTSTPTPLTFGRPVLITKVEKLVSWIDDSRKVVQNYHTSAPNISHNALRNTNASCKRYSTCVCQSRVDLPAPSQFYPKG